MLLYAYLTQRLEYRFHTARVIGSIPIVGKCQTFGLCAHLLFFDLELFCDKLKKRFFKKK